ncbi:hypothetical protein F5Y16DRAFT_389948 [Xylariaceae sp. FL0255]|nr:hypothetical protein F5Y16DRAFT_389948 [Xylariaceae sp. FL0255]
MRSTTIFSLAAALAGVALSQESGWAYCTSKNSWFYSWAQQAPTPTEILDFIATRTDIPGPVLTFDPEQHINQLCAISKALPQSLAHYYNAYDSAVRDLVAASPNVLIEVATQCENSSRAASITNYLNQMYATPRGVCDPPPGATTTSTVPACTAVTTSSNPYTYPTTPAPTSTGSTKPSNGTSTTAISTSVPIAGATRPTGILLGAAAAAGVLGAAVLL